MPVQEFALDASGSQRVQVHWTPESSVATVMLNNNALGALATPEERMIGKDFILPDSSLLQVRFANEQPQVWRNGAPLTLVGMPNSAYGYGTAIQPAKKRGGCLTAWLIFDMVVAAILAVVSLLAFIGAQSQGYAASVSILFLISALLNIADIIGLAMLFRWKKIGFYIIAAGVICNIPLTFISISQGLSTNYASAFTPIIGLGVLYFILKRTNVWQHLA